MRLPSLSLFAALLLPAVASAEVYFNEDFEPGGVYTIDRPIRFGYGFIRHGQWKDVGKAFQTGIIVADGERHVVRLSHPPNKSGARIIGSFGLNAEENSRADGPLRVRLSLKYSGPLDETFMLLIYGGDGKSRATIGGRGGGNLFASFGGVREELSAPLEPDRWYLLEFLLPEKPTNKSRWTFNLYEEDSKRMIDSRQGSISRSIEEGGNNYNAIDIQIRNPETVLYIDDIKVEAHAP